MQGMSRGRRSSAIESLPQAAAVSTCAMSRGVSFMRIAGPAERHGAPFRQRHGTVAYAGSSGNAPAVGRAPPSRHGRSAPRGFDADVELDLVANLGQETLHAEI